jgi:hypothetical protein
LIKEQNSEMNVLRKLRSYHRHRVELREKQGVQLIERIPNVLRTSNTTDACNRTISMN